MKKLIAKHPILYRSKQYKVGDVLPADDAAMVKAWLDAKTAAWVEEIKASTPKAKLVGKAPGLDATSSNSQDPEPMVGKVAKTAARQKK